MTFLVLFWDSCFFLSLARPVLFFALEQREGIKNSPYSRQGESREMAKAILLPFYHFLHFFLALSPLERLKEEIRRAGCCFTPILSLIDFAGNQVFPFNGKSQFGGGGEGFDSNNVFPWSGEARMSGRMD